MVSQSCLLTITSLLSTMATSLLPPSQRIVSLWPSLARMVSLFLPPKMSSRPSPPVMSSSPLDPCSVSSPSPPSTVSSPGPAFTSSLPPLAFTVSLPPRALMLSLLCLPVIWSDSPVPRQFCPLRSAQLIVAASATPANSVRSNAPTTVVKETRFIRAPSLPKLLYTTLLVSPGLRDGSLTSHHLLRRTPVPVATSVRELIPHDGQPRNYISCSYDDFASTVCFARRERRPARNSYQDRRRRDKGCMIHDTHLIVFLFGLTSAPKEVPAVL